MSDISSMIDHTFLKPDGTKKDIKKLCEEAIEYGFVSVCINPIYVKYAKKLLEESNVKIATVIGFPLGCTTKETKVFEATEAIKNGADELDMVINIGALKDKEYETVREDIKGVVESSRGRALVKVIIETCLLTDDEKMKACQLAMEAGADFVKTSTGFSSGGATLKDVELMKSVVGDKLGVKASGGIRDFDTAMKMVKAGASRIGASSSVKIIKDMNQKK
jgi:deoxyribose-phosphate aldolase